MRKAGTQKTRFVKTKGMSQIDEFFARARRAQKESEKSSVAQPVVARKRQRRRKGGNA